MFRKDLAKNFSNFNKIVLQESIFNESVFESMKSVAKFKYLHSGLKIVENILTMLKTQDTQTKVKVLETLFENKGFTGVLIRNVQMPKNQLHDMAKLVKIQLVDVLTQLKENPDKKTKEFFYKLLKDLFGPNSFSHFSAKKNQDIMLPLSNSLSSDHISDYIESWLSGMYSSPDLAVFYPGCSEDSVDQKRSAIKQFALTQLSSITQIFSEVTPQHVMFALNVLVKAAYIKENDSKIFGFIGQLQKT